MKRTFILFLMILICASSMSGCSGNSAPDTGYQKYTDEFFGTFDTLVKVVGYTRTKAEFEGYMSRIHARFDELNKLYDIYHDYDGLNNIKTINDNAGVTPVKVSADIISLILFSKEWHDKTGGAVNIAMGAVLKIWHTYREDGIADPAAAALPDMDALKIAAEHTDINRVIVDKANGTVYLEDKFMSLDVGAIAKGYATELITGEMQTAGFISGIISGGGNVRTFGKPMDGIREKWGIGIQDPKSTVITSDSPLLDTVFVRDMSVVTSGDYQRYYIVNDKVYNHIINPATLFPADRYHAVTIFCKDSGEADYLSTTLFILPYEEGRALIESLDGVEALWVFPDYTVKTTPGMKAVMKTAGGATYK